MNDHDCVAQSDGLSDDHAPHACGESDELRRLRFQVRMILLRHEQSNASIQAFLSEHGRVQFLDDLLAIQWEHDDFQGDKLLGLSQKESRGAGNA